MFAANKKPLSASRSALGGLSIIGPDVVVSGDLSASAQLHIEGRVDGDVRCETLIQGENGTICGQVVAEEARLAGLVDGTVKARSVSLEPTARITGDITYETLSIAAGAQIDGRVARREAIEAAKPPADALAGAAAAQPILFAKQAAE